MMYNQVEKSSFFWTLRASVLRRGIHHPEGVLDGVKRGATKMQQHLYVYDGSA